MIGQSDALKLSTAKTRGEKVFLLTFIYPGLVPNTTGSVSLVNTI